MPSIPIRGTLAIVALVCCVPRPTPAQDQAPPCRHPELGHAAFLEGEWQVRVRERVGPGDDDWRERQGTSIWRWRVDRCVMMEELSLQGGPRAYSEARLLAYDGRAEEWDLAIVDSEHGNLVTMTGRAVAEGLEFTSAQSRRGRILLDRVRLRRVTDNELEYRVEASFDAGATWTTLVAARYVRGRR